MARDFVLHIEGEVGGKGRPRTRIVFGGSRPVLKEEVEQALAQPGWLDVLRGMFSGKPFATIYPDPDSARMERLIKGLAYGAMAGRPLFECPLELTVEVFKNQPASWPRGKRLSAWGHFLTGKPDVDNIVKLIADAFNETVWKDDTLIADLIVRRRYTEERPSVVVTVRELTLQAGADLFAGADSR